MCPIDLGPRSFHSLASSLRVHEAEPARLSSPENDPRPFSAVAQVMCISLLNYKFGSLRNAPPQQTFRRQGYPFQHWHKCDFAKTLKWKLLVSQFNIVHDGRKLVASETFLVPGSGDTNVSVPYEEDSLRIKITTPSDEEDENSRIKAELEERDEEEDIVVLKIINFIKKKLITPFAAFPLLGGEISDREFRLNAKVQPLYAREGVEITLSLYVSEEEVV